MTPDEYDELAAVYLRKLAAADMKAWREHQRTTERGGGVDALSSLQAEKIEPHAQPPKPRKPYVLTEAGREKRKAQARRHRAMSPARATAIAVGDNTYKRHSPCKRCGGYLYYVAGQNCVACAKVASRKSEAKKRAAAKRAESAAPNAIPARKLRPTQIRHTPTLAGARSKYMHTQPAAPKERRWAMR